MNRIEKAVELIVNLMENAIKEKEERWDFKFERTNMQDFLDEIYDGMTSKEFKEEVRYVLTDYDNQLYDQKITDKNEYINQCDDGSIVDGQLDVSYRQLMNMVRKRIFKDTTEEE